MYLLRIVPLRMPKTLCSSTWVWIQAKYTLNQTFAMLGESILQFEIALKPCEIFEFGLHLSLEGTHFTYTLHQNSILTLSAIISLMLQMEIIMPPLAVLMTS